MKTIIILMLALICQFVNGQINPKTIKDHAPSYFEVEVDTTYYIYTDDSEILVKDYIEAKILKFIISEYDKYSKECYADSTLLKHQHFMPEGERYCIVDWECLNPDHYRDYYVHTIPTFPGFMEWLKTKIQ